MCCGTTNHRRSDGDGTPEDPRSEPSNLDTTDQALTNGFSLLGMQPPSAEAENARLLRPLLLDISEYVVEASKLEKELIQVDD